MKAILGFALFGLSSAVLAGTPEFRYVQGNLISKTSEYHDSYDDEETTERGVRADASFTGGSLWYFPLSLRVANYTTQYNQHTSSEASLVTLSAGAGLRFTPSDSSAIFVDYSLLSENYRDKDDDEYSDSNQHNGNLLRAGWRWMPGDTLEFLLAWQRQTMSYSYSDYTEKYRTIGLRAHLTERMSVGVQTSNLRDTNYWDSTRENEVNFRFSF